MREHCPQPPQRPAGHARTRHRDVALEKGPDEVFPPCEAALEGFSHQIEDTAINALIARNRAKEFALMSLYMQRTQRACEKYKKELREVQAERKAREAAELEEARPLFQMSETEGSEFDPAADGIVSSKKSNAARPDFRPKYASKTYSGPAPATPLRICGHNALPTRERANTVNNIFECPKAYIR